MSKKAVIFLAEGFEETEAITTIDILRRASVDVTIAGLGGKQIRGSHGITVAADITVDDVDSGFDACLLPGGMPGATHLAASKEINTLITDMHAQGKIIAAICASPAVVLSPLGILKNKSATCFPGMNDRFDPSTSFQEKPVVIDGNIITSRGVGTALPFALSIVEQLMGKTTRDKIATTTLAE